MSYILDALRKADAERERDPARGIHAQAMATPAAAARTSPVAIVAGALAGIALVAVGAYAWRARTPDAPARVIAAVPAAPLAVQPAPVAPLATPPAPAAVAAANALQPPAPAPLPQPELPKVVKVASVTPPLTITAAVPASAPAAAASPAARPAAPDRIVAQAELPPDVQRDLPKLAISGGVYSENPAQRMLIVGGQVVNEGAELAPGVVLEQIRARAAVLRFRSWRYSVGY